MKNPHQSYSDLMKLIKTHGIITNIDNSETLAQEAEELHLKTALFSTKMIIEKIEMFAKNNNKKILYVLSYPGRRLAKFITEGTRFDQEFVDFLNQKELLYVDLLEEHKKDFLNYRLDINDYINKYFIGHYNPLGNFFCAHTLRNKLTQLLDPKPLPYR
jgi:hypothetical protein